MAERQQRRVVSVALKSFHFNEKEIKSKAVTSITTTLIKKKEEEYWTDSDETTTELKINNDNLKSFEPWTPSPQSASLSSSPSPFLPPRRSGLSTPHSRRRPRAPSPPPSSPPPPPPHDKKKEVDAAEVVPLKQKKKQILTPISFVQQTSTSTQHQPPPPVATILPPPPLTPTTQTFRPETAENEVPQQWVNPFALPESTLTKVSLPPPPPPPPPLPLFLLPTPSPPPPPLLSPLRLPGIVQPSLGYIQNNNNSTDKLRLQEVQATANSKQVRNKESPANNVTRSAEQIIQECRDLGSQYLCQIERELLLQEKTPINIPEKMLSNIKTWVRDTVQSCNYVNVGEAVEKACTVVFQKRWKTEHDFFTIQKCLQEVVVLFDCEYRKLLTVLQKFQFMIQHCYQQAGLVQYQYRRYFDRVKERVIYCEGLLSSLIFHAERHWNIQLELSTTVLTFQNLHAIAKARILHILDKEKKFDLLHEGVSAPLWFEWPSALTHVEEDADEAEEDAM